MKDLDRTAGSGGTPAAGGGSALEQMLLTAARRDYPSFDLQLRMARALGIPAAVTASAAASAAAPAAVATSLSGSTLALLSVGVLASLVAAGFGVRAFVQRSSRAAEPAELPAIAAPGAGIAAPFSPPPAVVSAATSTTPEPVAVTETAVADEVRVLDLARAALREGAPARALEHLDDYAERHPHGALMPEAAVLRIEALMRAGRSGPAGSLARQFSARYPASPLRMRVEHLLASGSR